MFTLPSFFSIAIKAKIKASLESVIIGSGTLAVELVFLRRISMKNELCAPPPVTKMFLEFVALNALFANLPT